MVMALSGQLATARRAWSRRARLAESRRRDPRCALRRRARTPREPARSSARVRCDGRRRRCRNVIIRGRLPRWRPCAIASRAMSATSSGSTTSPMLAASDAEPLRLGFVVFVAPEHAGVHRVRAQARDGDPEVRVVERDPFGEPQRTVLGERVAERRRSRDQRGRRDGLHQVPGAFVEHGREHALRSPDVREQVHVDDRAHLVGGRRQIGTAIPDSRVGAEDVHRSVFGFSAVDQRADHGGVAYVADERNATDPCGDLLRPLGVQVGDHDTRAITGETFAQRAVRSRVRHPSPRHIDR